MASENANQRRAPELVPARQSKECPVPRVNQDGASGRRLAWQAIAQGDCTPVGNGSPCGELSDRTDYLPLPFGAQKDHP